MGALFGCCGINCCCQHCIACCSCWGPYSVPYSEAHLGNARAVISGETEDINSGNCVLAKISTEYKKNKKDGSVQYWFMSADEMIVSILRPASRVTGSVGGLALTRGNNMEYQNSGEEYCPPINNTFVLGAKDH
eukprot:sb/3474790/